MELTRFKHPSSKNLYHYNYKKCDVFTCDRSKYSNVGATTERELATDNLV